MNAALIGVDWGSTNLRACLLDASGEVLEERHSDQGVLGLEGERFGETLDQLLAEWTELGLPRLLCGMVGSSRGWREAPYVECPANHEQLADALLVVSETTHIVPGLTGTSVAGTPDVMRGEECQLIGAMEIEPAMRDGVICLPGTHSKWVHTKEGRVTSFSTALSGESYALFTTHSILAPTASEGESLRRSDPGRPFDRGVEHSGTAGGILHHLFAARALMLRGQILAGEVQEFLSGLLIGHELRALAPDSRVCLVGDAKLCKRYSRALSHLGREAVHVDGLLAVARGLACIARSAGLLPTRP